MLAPSLILSDSMPPTSGHGLKVLIEEARRRHDDTRPEMLRVLVGLYLDAPDHDAVEKARFERLTLRLLEAVDTGTAARLMRPLAPRADLPHGLALHLAQGPLALAGPVLRLSPVLDDDTLADIAASASPAHAAAIAARREVSPALAKRLAALVDRSQFGDLQKPAASVAPTLPDPSSARIEAADSTPAPTASRKPLSAPFAERVAAVAVIDATPSEMPSPDAACEPLTLAADVGPTATQTEETDAPAPSAPISPVIPDYLAAEPEERALIVARLVLLAPVPLGERVQPAGPELTDALLDAARRADRTEITAWIEKALGASATNAGRIVDDASGQALAVAAKALGLSFAVLTRVLFRLHPVAGRSAADMARLADMFDSLPLASAQHLVASWRGVRQPLRERAEPAPSMRSFAQPRPASLTAPNETQLARNPGETRL